MEIVYHFCKALFYIPKERHKRRKKNLFNIITHKLTFFDLSDYQMLRQCDRAFLGLWRHKLLHRDKSCSNFATAVAKFRMVKAPGQEAAARTMK